MDVHFLGGMLEFLSIKLLEIVKVFLEFLKNLNQKNTFFTFFFSFLNNLEIIFFFIELILVFSKKKNNVVIPSKVATTDLTAPGTVRIFQDELRIVPNSRKVFFF